VVRVDQEGLKKLGPALRYLRERARLSMPEVQARTGVDPSNQVRYEKGRTAPSFPVLTRLLASYESDFEELGRLLKLEQLPTIDGEGVQAGPLPPIDEIEEKVLRALRHYGLVPGEEDKKERSGS
jgi:transcriptional regulator with XRE-family HTH domain